MDVWVCVRAECACVCVTTEWSWFVWRSQFEIASKLFGSFIWKSNQKITKTWICHFLENEKNVATKSLTSSVLIACLSALCSILCGFVVVAVVVLVNSVVYVSLCSAHAARKLNWLRQFDIQLFNFSSNMLLLIDWEKLMTLICLMHEWRGVRVVTSHRIQSRYPHTAHTKLNRLSCAWVYIWHHQYEKSIQTLVRYPT